MLQLMVFIKNVIKGFTVLNPVIPQSKFTYHSDLTSGDL